MMRIFGLNIGARQIPTPIITPETRMVHIRRDQAPTVRPELTSAHVPENKKPANIPQMKPIVLSYAAMNARRGMWNNCEYDLALINRIEDTDSYVSQAFIKKIGLMFKEGYDFVGPDPKTVQYVKTRFSQIARATGISTDELLRMIGTALVKKSNGFLVKARKESASGGKVRSIPGGNRELQPVAGYFIMPAELMWYEADIQGIILRWKIRLPDGRFQYFKPEDVVHFYFNRKEGFIYGTPTIQSVIDDIRSLRKIEENIELLVYQHLFPLFHYKVGTDDMPASVDEQGNDEIEVARHAIREMPAEGGLVTNHRHTVELIGAENRSLRAEGYLEHFKKRVFSGLGISAVDMGEGECYSADTQTLTENGWKYHWQIDHKHERIATYNPATNAVEFHLANYKYEGKYEGKMIHFTNGEELDVLVTPNHDMWFNQSRSREWSKVHAIDLINSEKLRGNLLLTTSFSEDEVIDVFPTEYIEDWCKVAGYVISGGRLEGNKIVISSTKIPRGPHPLVSSFRNLQIDFSSNKVGTSPRKLEISFDSSVFSGAFQRYLPSNGSKVVNEVLRLPIAARKIIADSILEVGARSKGKKWMTGIGKVLHRWYISDNQDVLDLVQTILLSCGYNATIKSTMWRNKQIRYVNVRCGVNRIHTSLITHDETKIVNYSGEIYCYNVPNHLFLTRRNGKVAINGNTANRATSDNMSRNLVDSVKDLQRCIETQVSEFIINELLLESTFGSDVLNEEHRVYLKFKEIDLDYQIKKEAHLSDQFSKNVISMHEARIGAGRQPMRIPTVDEVQSGEDLSEQFPEWHATHWKLIDEPKSLIQAIDEPYSAQALAAADNRATSISPDHQSEAGDQQKTHEVELEKEKAKAKIAIAKMKPKPKPAAKKRDSFLATRFERLQSDTVNLLTAETYTPSWFKQIAFMTETEMIKELNAKAMTAFTNGYRSTNPSGLSQIDAIMRNRSKVEDRVVFYVRRLIKHTMDAISRQNIDGLEKGVKIQKVKAAFDALKYRNEFIEDVELRKAYNLGVLEAAKDQGRTHWTLETPVDACESCKAAAKITNEISKTGIEDIPPLHANSRSKIRII